MNNKHEFAFYYPQMSKLQPKKTFELHDADIAHRMSNILRLEPGEAVVLFDTNMHAEAKIVQFKGKKNIVFAIEAVVKNNLPEPHIICLLPLLKRQAFDEALYALAQMGIAIVQPIVTHKSIRGWGVERDFERAKNIFIAAAEQSKQYILPEIKPVLSLDDAIKNYKANKSIFFDVAGASAWPVITQLRQEKIKELVICFGPEGDLTEAEKVHLQANNYEFCALTPSILKAEQAIALAVGLLRSLL